MDIIYVDELFALNFLVDYMLLLGSARLRGGPLRRGRFVLGGLIGGLYAVLTLLPGLEWLDSAGMKLGVSVLLCLAAYGGEVSLFRAWLCFTALSAGFGGTLLALSLLFPRPAGRPLFSFPALLLSTGLCYAVVRLFFTRFTQRRQREILPVELCLSARRVSLSALRDTGNSLRDPLTGLAVMVADPVTLCPLFPPEALPGLLGEDPPAQLSLLGKLPELQGRFRLIPYTAVGIRQGLLLCFRPDSMTVGRKPEQRLVALSPTPLCDDGEYSAVL